MSVNKAILVGRLGKDPETRYMTSGEAVTNATLATSENWKDKSGEKQERTEWHSLVFYRRLAEIAGEYLKKGSQVYIEGRIQTRKWQDKEGRDRYTTEIVVNEMKMLGGRDSTIYAAIHEKTKTQSFQQDTENSPIQNNGAADEFDDDIPF